MTESILSSTCPTPAKHQQYRSVWLLSVNGEGGCIGRTQSIFRIVKLFCMNETILYSTRVDNVFIHLPNPLESTSKT